METRKQHERDFHNRLRRGVYLQRWAPETETRDPLWSNMKYYSIERSSRRWVEDWLRERCRGKRVLDYCCGNGEDALFVARNGAAHVVGIDISDVAIENCRQRARDEGLEEQTSFQVMDAEAMRFDPNTFDLVVVYGVLHHLDLRKAMSELCPVLKPDGHIVCTEALRHNPVIHLYRRLTPHLRTEWEVDHILGRREILRMKAYFNRVEVQLFHLATLLAVPLRNHRAFPTVLRNLETLDRLLLRIPGLRWWAWQAVFLLSQPKKSSVRAAA